MAGFLFLLVASAPVAIATSSNANLIIADGRALAAIVVADDATPGERYAAAELSTYLQQITGVELPPTLESTYAKANGLCVSVGRTQLSRAYVSDEKLQSFGDDGYVSFTKEGQAFLIGGRKRGTLYAVYAFLETLGVRWYSPDYTVVPRTNTIRLPTASEAIPCFWYRDQWWNNSATSEWLARMRVNGSNGQDHELPAAMGGSVKTLHTCHSYADLVLPKKNFVLHPDWFAVKESGRRDSQRELCLTNPELREYVAQRVLAELRNQREPVDYFWVSQNDGGKSGCFCARCTAERDAHGGADRWSANNIAFANYVAARVQPEFPRVRIKTLAYSYTQEAPDDMTAAENVSVEICGNFGAEASDPQRKRVERWAQVARNISVYTYGGSNFGYWWPYPNVTDLGLQCKRASAVGVTAFFVQGTALGRGSGLVDLKAYVSARMAWDPSRDVRMEIRDFCTGFYGPGGRYIVEYLDWYADYIRQRKMILDGGWGDADRWRRWVTKETMAHCDALFQQALAATKDQPIYAQHVRRAYLEVLCGDIMINLKPKTNFMDQELSLEPGADRKQIQRQAALFGEIMRENNYDRWSETTVFDPAKYPR